ncbi:11945_t:CDS:1, partial [Racocetra fulgida]
SHEAEDITSHEAEEIAKCAYIFGYPLVLMNITKQTMIKQTPINQFYHMREFPTDGFTDV